MASDALAAQGISWAMLGLLGMMLVVWAGLGAFFINTWRRSRRAESELAVSSNGQLLPADTASPS